MKAHLLVLVLLIIPAASQAHTLSRCSAAEHAAQEREPRRVLLISGLATMAGGVAALASGEHSTLATIYLLNAPALAGLIGFYALPCAVDPTVPDSRSAEERERLLRESKSPVLYLVAFNTAVAGTTVLLSQNSTSRVIAGIATGLSAVSPLLYLNRFLDDGAPERISVQLGVPTQVTVTF
jgi:hypothetical protein